MTGIDGKLVSARLWARNFERSCTTFGAKSVEAALARSNMWRSIIEAMREMAEEVGDATAGALSPDEISAPSEEWARVVCTAVAMRAAELARGR